MNEILEYYLTVHNQLGQQVDAKDKETFDIEHRHIWGNCDLQLRERMSELEAIPMPTNKDNQEIVDIRSYLDISK